MKPTRTKRISGEVSTKTLCDRHYSGTVVCSEPCSLVFRSLGTRVGHFEPATVTLYIEYTSWQGLTLVNPRPRFPCTHIKI